MGHNAESSREINNEISDYFNESQIFRIDHYLGKETVQNLILSDIGIGPVGLTTLAKLITESTAVTEVNLSINMCFDAESARALADVTSMSETLDLQDICAELPPPGVCFQNPVF